MGALALPIFGAPACSGSSGNAVTPDAGGAGGACNVTSGACSVDPPCGCAEGEKCARENGAAAACEPNGAGKEDAVCTTSADCAADYYCVADLCLPLCKGTCSEANYQCLQTGYDGELYGYGVCAPHCDLIAPGVASGAFAACGADETCEPSSLTAGATHCAPSTGSATQGQPCTDDGACAPGYACEQTTGGSEPGTCWRYCDMSIASPCGSNDTLTTALGATVPTACVPYSPPLIISGSNFGVCLPTSPKADSCGKAWASAYFMPACAACLASSCCSATEACGADSSCISCLGDTGCADSASADAAALKECLSTTCASSCGCNGAC